jgi:long-chain acyl-CoA synthetase
MQATYPREHARSDSGRAACVMAATGEVVTYGQLEARANQGAHLMRACGLLRGDVAAIVMDNNARYFEVVWAAQRAGLYFTCIPAKSTATEIEYILRDCDAKLLVVSAGVAPIAAELSQRLPHLRIYMVGAAHASIASFETARESHPATPIADESAGADMLYSSGTTGKPKGVKLPLSGGPIDTPVPLDGYAVSTFKFRTGCTYLSTAPLYHATPLRFGMTVHRLGGTIVVMEKFDAQEALALIEKHRIDCATFVPTHFVRLLKLPEEVRTRYDTSSLRSAVHGAAPCPVPVKKAMIDWWGPVLYEYYSGTEGIGMCCIGSQDWLKHPGSVGKAVFGQLHVCDENGDEVPPRTEGLVYFSGGWQFQYNKDPDKTAQGYNRHGWSTIGDIGWADEEGYLYLTDRKSFMIISGGVNIYPQEIENLLVTHPKVADVGVIGAPDEDMGEKVVALVQPANWADAGPALQTELEQFVRASLAPYKVPRVFDFLRELPRSPTGKLVKGELRKAYVQREAASCST